MRKNRIKSLILTAAFAIGVGVTGIIATAQAAEERGVLKAGCSHPADKWNYVDAYISYDTRDNNRFTHTKYILVLYTCGTCGDFIEVKDEVQEEHDLVYNYIEDKYECSHCDYWE